MTEIIDKLPAKPTAWSDLRLIWVQLHGSHQSWNPEGVLHDNGFPFLVGKHQLDDPNCYAAMGDPAVIGPDGERLTGVKLAYTTQMHPPSPPTGGYQHLSWCYFNKEPAETLIAALDAVHTQDPEACQLLFIREGYPQFRALVERIQGARPQDWAAPLSAADADAQWADRQRRTVVFFHKATWIAWHGDDAATTADEAGLWPRADHVIVTPHATRELPAEWAKHRPTIEAGSHELLDGHFNVAAINAVADRARQLIFARL